MFPIPIPVGSHWIDLLGFVLGETKIDPSDRMEGLMPLDRPHRLAPWPWREAVNIFVFSIGRNQSGKKRARRSLFLFHH